MFHIRRRIEILQRRKTNLRIFISEEKKIRNCKRKDRKAILILIDSFYRAGSQRVAAELAGGLSKNYAVTVICKRKLEPEYPVAKDVNILYIPEFAGRGKEQLDCRIKFIRWVKRKLKTKVSISLLLPMNSLNVNTRAGEKVICSERNNPSKREPENMDLIRGIYEEADHVVFQSQAVRNLFPQSVQSHSSVIRNPVDVEVKRKSETRHRIVSIGRLHPQKNQELLIRAFDDFHSDHPEYELAVYGEGYERLKLETLVHDLGLEGAVLLPGNIVNVHEAVADAEMFVLSSDYEGLPNALLECMTMGMPCISTACDGAVDVITDHENGLLTQPGNKKELTDAMQLLAEDSALREKLGMNAMRSSEMFRKDRIIEQWEQLIENLS